jgi:tetratricopeptide (TPR) repeat protein
MFYCPLILLVAMTTVGIARDRSADLAFRSAAFLVATMTMGAEAPVAPGSSPQGENCGTKPPLRLELTPAGSCTANDPSVSFSGNLGLPAAHVRPWIALRAAILQRQFNRANELLRDTPPSATRWFWQGVLMLQEQKTFASIRNLEQAAHAQDNCRTERQLAVDYFLLNQRMLAADALGRAFRFNPHDGLALYLRGRLSFVSDAFLPAERDFGAFLTLEPNDYRGLYYRAISEQHLGQGALAQKHLRRSVDVLVCHHLSFWRAPYALAQIRLQNDEAEEAMRDVSLSLEMAHASVTESRPTALATILVLRGKIEEHLGKADAAEGDWRQAVKLDPYRADAWYLLARLYRKQEKLSQAQHALEQFRRIQSEL